MKANCKYSLFSQEWSVHVIGGKYSVDIHGNENLLKIKIANVHKTNLKFNWENDEKKIISLYEKIINPE